MSRNARKNLACKANIAKLFFFLSCPYWTNRHGKFLALFPVYSRHKPVFDRNANLTEQVKRAMKYSARVWLANSNNNTGTILFCTRHFSFFFIHVVLVLVENPRRATNQKKKKKTQILFNQQSSNSIYCYFVFAIMLQMKWNVYLYIHVYIMLTKLSYFVDILYIFVKFRKHI